MYEHRRVEGLSGTPEAHVHTRYTVLQTYTGAHTDEQFV